MFPRVSNRHEKGDAAYRLASQCEAIAALRPACCRTPGWSECETCRTFSASPVATCRSCATSSRISAWSARRASTRLEPDPERRQLLADIVVQVSGDLGSLGLLSEYEPMRQGSDSLVGLPQAGFLVPKGLLSAPAIGDVSSDALQLFDPARPVT